MEDIYTYESVENGYTENICLVDKLKIFKILKEIINVINLDYSTEETEDYFLLIFKNKKKIKVFGEFMLQIDEFEPLELNDANITNRIKEFLPVYINETVESENETEEIDDFDSDNKSCLDEMDEENIELFRLCKDFGVEDYLDDEEFYSIITTESDVSDEFNSYSTEEQYKILIYLAYINSNVDIDLKLRFRKPYVGLFNEDDRKFYCMILFSRNVLRIDGEDRLSIENLTKFDIDQCFGFNGVPLKKIVINNETKKTKTKSVSSSVNNFRYNLYDDDDDDDDDGDDDKCPWCGDYLVVKNGRRGKFYSCSSYPLCRYSRDYDDDYEECPWCGASLVLKYGRLGWFYSCSRWPRCNYSKDAD